MKCPVFGDKLDRTIGNNIIMDSLITGPQSLVQTIMMMMIIMIDECPRNTWNYVNTGMDVSEGEGNMWHKERTTVIEITILSGVSIIL